jgi:hypothetical protein
MSTENTIVEPVTDDLDAFSAELFGQSKAQEPASSKEEDEIDEQDSDAQIDTHEADTLDNEDDDTDAEDGEPDKAADEAKPKKNRFQERIDEVVGKQRDAERKAEELERKLTEALARLESKDDKTPAPAPKDAEASTGPKPTDMNEDGTEKYPLGEFDPGYIKDLMRHTLHEEQELRAAEAEKQKELAQKDEAVAELQKEWNAKLEPAKERYPDFQEKGEQMLTVFEGIDPAYGEYLTNTIMELEYGPDVFYYLANNVDEAKAIVDGGARKATAMLGRIEAQFVEAGEKKPVVKVSTAPKPPEHLNRGSAMAKPAVRGDEDDIDLDDFAKELFKKRR